jgi:hypothetical protein
MVSPLPTLKDADELHELIRKVQNNEPVPPPQRRLISPGATMGGARPKGLIDIAGHQWVIKFSDGDPADTPLIEHAAMTLAQKAGIRTAQTQAVRLTHGHAVAIKRFRSLARCAAAQPIRRCGAASRGRTVRLPGTGTVAAASGRDRRGCVCRGHARSISQDVQHFDRQHR